MQHRLLPIYQVNYSEGARDWQAIYPRGLEIPDGWVDCPPYGTNIENINIIPVKVTPETPKLKLRDAQLPDGTRQSSEAMLIC